MRLELLLGMIVPVRVLSMGQIDLFKNYLYLIGPCAKNEKQWNLGCWTLIVPKFCSTTDLFVKWNNAAEVDSANRSVVFGFHRLDSCVRTLKICSIIEVLGGVELWILRLVSRLITEVPLYLNSYPPLKKYECTGCLKIDATHLYDHDLLLRQAQCW